MHNRVTLAQLGDMATHEAAALPVEHIAALLEEAAELKATHKEAEERLHAILHHRYGEHAANHRSKAGKDTGSVTIPDGEFSCKADLPPKVEWNQALLREAEVVVKGWGEDPTQYLTYVLSIPESRYKAWPDSIRKVFEPARTVGTGKPSYKLERAKGRIG